MKNKTTKTDCLDQEKMTQRLHGFASRLRDAYEATKEAIRQENDAGEDFYVAVIDGVKSNKLKLYLLTESNKIATVHVESFSETPNNNNEYELKGRDVWSGWEFSETLRMDEYDKKWSFDRRQLDIILKSILKAKEEARKKKENDILTAKRMAEDLKKAYNIDDERLRELLPYFQAEKSAQ